MLKNLAFQVVFILIFLSGSVIAKTIAVSDGESHYEISYSKKEIKFKEPGFKKELKEKKCNRKFFKGFIEDLKEGQKSLVQIKGGEKLRQGTRVIIGKKTFFALDILGTKNFLTEVPSKFKTLWLTSERVCAK